MSLVIAAVDDSAAARPVILTAQAAAPVFGAAVEAVHVAADAEGRTAASVASACGCEYRLLTGDALERLLAEVGREEVAAIVCGVRSRPTGRRRVGHLALQLADAVEKPVIVVPPDARPPEAINRVLIAMKGTSRSAVRLRRTVELVSATGLEMHVVHVDDEESIPSFTDQIQYEADLYAQEFLARYVPGAPPAALTLRIGAPAEQVLDVADAIAPDIIAAGWPHRPGAGDVVREIVERSRVPVLLVATA